MNKKYLLIALSIFVILISTTSIVFAATIVDSNYEGQGVRSFLGGAHLYEGSDVTHNSTFTISLDLNVSGDISAENFTGMSDIVFKKLFLEDNAGHTISIGSDNVSIDSAYMDGDILHIVLSGGFSQHITSSSELNNIFNFDNATVTGMLFGYGSKTLDARP